MDMQRAKDEISGRIEKITKEISNACRVYECFEKLDVSAMSDCHIFSESFNRRIQFGSNCCCQLTTTLLHIIIYDYYGLLLFYIMFINLLKRQNSRMKFVFSFLNLNS